MDKEYRSVSDKFDKAESKEERQDAIAKIRALTERDYLDGSDIYS